MLVVKVELWPGGDPERAVEIGRAAAANVSDLKDFSDYVIVAANDRGEHAQGMVIGHRRKRGFWPLVAAIATVAVSTAEDLEKAQALAAVKDKFKKLPDDMRRRLAKESKPVILSTFTANRDQEALELFSRRINQ